MSCVNDRVLSEAFCWSTVAPLRGGRVHGRLMQTNMNTLLMCILLSVHSLKVD